jgi:hypothetical protein
MIIYLTLHSIHIMYHIPAGYHEAWWVPAITRVDVMLRTRELRELRGCGGLPGTCFGGYCCCAFDATAVHLLSSTCCSAPMYV